MKLFMKFINSHINKTYHNKNILSADNIQKLENNPEFIKSYNKDMCRIKNFCNSNINIEELRKVFKEGPSIYTGVYGWQHNFDDISTTDSLIYSGYIHSYLQGGSYLIEKNIPDEMMYSIIFLYRQYLELLLKNICRQNTSEEKYIKILDKVSHCLDKLWEETCPFIQCDKKDKDFIKYVIIDIFHKIDPYSFNFRYPTDKKLNESLEPLTINFEILRRAINKIDNILYNTYAD